MGNYSSFFGLITLKHAQFFVDEIKESSGVYYDFMGKVKIQRDEWNLITYINITEMELQMRSFQILSSQTIFNCKSFEMFCDPHINLLDNLNEELEENIYNLNNILGNRGKRGWFDSVKTTIKIIHGIINPDEASQIEKLIDTKFDNTNEHRYLKNKIQLLKNSIFDVQNNVKKLINEVRNSTQYIKEVQSKNKKIHEYNSKKLTIVSDIIQVINFGNNIQQNLNLILTGILFSKNNIIHPKIISPKDLLKGLMDSTQYLPTNIHYTFLLNTPNIERLLTLSNIKVIRINKILVFMISNPLVTDEIYDIFSMFPLPMHVIKEKYIFTKTKREMLLISEDKSTFSFLENLQNCKQLQPEYFICKTVNPFFSRINSKICEIELLTEVNNFPIDCVTKVINIKRELWKKIHYYNTWIFVLPEPKKLTVDCRGNKSEIIIKNTGTLTLRPNCIGFTENTKLFAEVTDFNEKFYSIIPNSNKNQLIKLHIDLINNIKNDQMTIHNFDEIQKYGIAIDFPKEDDSNYATIYVVYTIVCILCLVFILTIIFVILILRNNKKQSLENTNENVITIRA